MVLMVPRVPLGQLVLQVLKVSKGRRVKLVYKVPQVILGQLAQLAHKVS
jgi:hypothetical protein